MRAICDRARERFAELDEELLRSPPSGLFDDPRRADESQRQLLFHDDREDDHGLGVVCSPVGSARRGEGGPLNKGPGEGTGGEDQDLEMLKRLWNPCTINVGGDRGAGVSSSMWDTLEYLYLLGQGSYRVVLRRSMFLSCIQRLHWLYSFSCLHLFEVCCRIMFWHQHDVVSGILAQKYLQRERDRDESPACPTPRYYNQNKLDSPTRFERYVPKLSYGTTPMQHEPGAGFFSKTLTPNKETDQILSLGSLGLQPTLSTASTASTAFAATASMASGIGSVSSVSSSFGGGGGPPGAPTPFAMAPSSSSGAAGGGATTSELFSTTGANKQTSNKQGEMIDPLAVWEILFPIMLDYGWLSDEKTLMVMDQVCKCFHRMNTELLCWKRLGLTRFYGVQITSGEEFGSTTALQQLPPKCWKV